MIYTSFILLYAFSDGKNITSKKQTVIENTLVSSLNIKESTANECIS